MPTRCAFISCLIQSRACHYRWAGFSEPLKGVWKSGHESIVAESTPVPQPKRLQHMCRCPPRRRNRVRTPCADPSEDTRPTDAPRVHRWSRAEHGDMAHAIPNDLSPTRQHSTGQAGNTPPNPANQARATVPFDQPIERHGIQATVERGRLRVCASRPNRCSVVNNSRLT